MMINRSYIACLGALAFVVSVTGAGLATTAAQAQILDRAIQGAIGGAIIGGATHGHHGRGAGKGAAIGAAAGAVFGAIEEEERRKSRQQEYDQTSTYPSRGTSRQDPLILDIQSSLTKLGYEPGPVDGAYGRRTSLAITEYQKENGLLVTGEPSQALLAHMNKQGS